LAGRGYFSKPMEKDINSELKAWLESEHKDIDQGITLFQKFSRNRALALYLIRKRDIRKLTYELEKLSKLRLLKPVNAPKPIAKAPTAPAKVTDNEQLIGRVDRAALPDHLKVVFDGITEAYKHQRVYHEKMKLAVNDEDRAAMRLEVVKIDDDIATGWNEIDAFLKGTAQDDQSAKAPADDPADVSKKINAARTAIARGLKNYDATKKDKLIESINMLIALNASVSTKTRTKLVELDVIKENSNLLGK